MSLPPRKTSQTPPAHPAEPAPGPVHVHVRRPARGAELEPDLPDYSLRALLDRVARFFKPKPARDALGDRGENVAATHLRGLGYKIIERNFRCQMGEIDIVARDGKTLVFVEVKTRLYDDPTPEEQVNAFKRHQLTKAAQYYLMRFGNRQPPARFDVVAVVWPTGRQPQIRHTPDAFEATF
jgi:putative endonuclease